MAAHGARLPAHVVGMAFANQYYQILTSSPQLLFHFYKEESTLGRLDHRGEMVSVTGMDAIKEKLLSVDFREYSVEITTVDGQESLDGAVFVLVAGYLTGKDDAKKKFAQFFMLAPQDNGYYVFNDILRLLDYANDQPLAPEQAEQLEQQKNEVPEEEKLDEAETIVPSAEISCSVQEEVQTGKETDEVSESLQAVTLNPSYSTTLEESPPRESYASIVNVMKEKPTPPVSPPVPSKPAVVKTGQLASPTSIPALVTENASVNPNAADSYRSREPEAIGYSIHLKNLPLYVTPEQLQEEFKKFGPIKSGGIHIKCFRVLFNSYLYFLFTHLPSNFVYISDNHIQVQQSGICFGFVDFEVADAVARAIEASPVTIEGRPAFVEKQRSSNLRASNRGRYRNERTRGRRSPSAASGVYGKGEDSSRTDFGHGGGSWSW